MCALVHDLVLDSGESVEDDGSGSALDIVDGLLRNGESNGKRHSQLVDSVECGSHFE